MRRIYLFSKDLLGKIATAVEEGIFPALDTVCVRKRFHIELHKEPAVQAMFEKNICVRDITSDKKQKTDLTNCWEFDWGGTSVKRYMAITGSCIIPFPVIML